MFKIRFLGNDKKYRYLHNTAVNAGVATFNSINDVMREVHALLCCGYSEITIERKEEK